VSRLFTALGLLGLVLAPLGCYATAGAYTEADYVEAERREERHQKRREERREHDDEARPR
jgi:hypothetical protein